MIILRDLEGAQKDPELGLTFRDAMVHYGVDGQVGPYMELRTLHRNSLSGYGPAGTFTLRDLLWLRNWEAALVQAQCQRIRRGIQRLAAIRVGSLKEEMVSPLWIERARIDLDQNSGTGGEGLALHCLTILPGAPALDGALAQDNAPPPDISGRLLKRKPGPRSKELDRVVEALREDLRNKRWLFVNGQLSVKSIELETLYSTSQATVSRALKIVRNENVAD